MENINFYIALFSNESYETFNVAFIKMFMINFYVILEMRVMMKKIYNKITYNRLKI